MSTPIAQKTLFGADERVADAITIAQSALADLPKNLERHEFIRRAEWLTLLRYPGALENILRIAAGFANRKANDVETVMALDIKGDTPRFDTISRAVREAAPASIDELR